MDFFEEIKSNHDKKFFTILIGTMILWILSITAGRLSSNNSSILFLFLGLTMVIVIINTTVNLVGAVMSEAVNNANTEKRLVKYEVYETISITPVDKKFLAVLEGRDRNKLVVWLSKEPPKVFQWYAHDITPYRSLVEK